jgi:hypothetical protein
VLEPGTYGHLISDIDRLREYDLTIREKIFQELRKYLGKFDELSDKMSYIEKALEEKILGLREYIDERTEGMWEEVILRYARRAEIIRPLIAAAPRELQCPFCGKTLGREDLEEIKRCKMFVCKRCRVSTNDPRFIRMVLEATV